jgi:hypothetical protein
VDQAIERVHPLPGAVVEEQLQFRIGGIFGDRAFDQGRLVSGDGGGHQGRIRTIDRGGTHVSTSQPFVRLPQWQHSSQMRPR